VGEELRKRRKVENMFREAGYELGFEEIETPMVEKIEAFPNDMFVDWDENNFFPLLVTDFKNREVNAKNKAILRPEGTLPVCRYLANSIVNGNNPLPAKLMYSITCFRNEPIDEVKKNTFRSFNQLGVETFGLEDNDDQVMYFADQLVKKIGVENVRFRVNDIRIFNNIASELEVEQKQELQMLLDSFSKKRAIGDAQSVELPYVRAEEQQLLRGSYMNAEQVGEVSPQLSALVGRLENLDIEAVADLSVVRGFNYYTGPVFQIDVKKDGKWIAEVAGGGRFDNIVGTYLSRFGIDKKVPATGFAFGTERLVEVSR